MANTNSQVSNTPNSTESNVHNIYKLTRNAECLETETREGIVIADNENQARSIFQEQTNGLEMYPHYDENGNSIYTGNKIPFWTSNKYTNCVKLGTSIGIPIGIICQSFYGSDFYM